MKVRVKVQKSLKCCKIADDFAKAFRYNVRKSHKADKEKKNSERKEGISATAS